LFKYLNNAFSRDKIYPGGDYQMTLGEKLKILREKRGWTQTQAAEKLGVSSQVVSNYERDYRSPDKETLSVIAVIYNCSLDWLIGNSEDPQRNNEETKKPDWATSRDLKDLKKFLEQKEVMFDGVPLSEEDKQRVQDVLTGLFWEAKQMNKRKKKDDT
jgi:transcriptional regulator with XRE-family HTH domain